tara:strand:- start:4563 stop:5420 length:858 start_codon:yes stop_codon:yes gene_type:complete
MATKESNAVVLREETLHRLIFNLRGQQVILDRDLATLYQVETRALKQAVKRNAKRFPADFMWVLDEGEVNELVSQSVIPGKSALGGALPFAFTEQGVAALSSVLTSDRAIEVNIAIMRAFVALRRMLAANDGLLQRMDTLERFLHAPDAPGALLKAALVHVQFETIHPFLDGNGRVGRLLIALVLHHEGVLRQPLLYLSLYLKQHRAEYYRLLDAVRLTGDWATWLDFFLEGVEQTAAGAVDTALRVFDALQRLGIVREITGRKRERVFAYSAYLAILNEGAERP